MQAIKKHSLVSMAIIVFILLNTKVAGRYHHKVKDFQHDDFNQDFEWKIQQSLNTTVDPCEDFYAYSCGNYNGYANSDENVREITQYLDQKYETKLRNMFEPKHSVDHKFSNKQKFFPYVYGLRWNAGHHNYSENNKQTFREKTQNYYESCIKENRTNLMKYFEELQIRWPLLSNPGETNVAFSKEDFWQALGQLQGYNWNNLIITHEITVSKDDSIDIILEPAYNNLPADTAIEGSLKALKVDNASVIVQQLKVTQLKWLEIFQNDTKNKYTYTGIALKNVIAKYPFLKLYLQQLLGVSVNKINRIWLRNVSFFNYFCDIEWPTEEWQQQMNYLMLHFLFYLFEDSTTEFTKKSCVKDLRNKLDVAVNYIYDEKIFLRKERNYMDMHNRLIRQIYFVIHELFEENKLNLTIQQVKHLKDKLHRIGINLGNLPNPVSIETIEQFYKEVPPLDNGNYFKNHLLLLKHRFLKSLLYKKNLNFYITADNSFGSFGSMFYVSQQNLVVVPFASLLYPLYHYNFKPQYQLSLTGFLMGHEMGHAFDKNELINTGHGAIVEKDLYKKSLECMQSQHPTDYIDERIADLFGERAAYRTYETFYNTDNNTNWQRQFYLSMAQFFCNKGDLEFIEHDPSDVRLKEIVKNSHGFAKAFNCPLDSPMNPQKKCRLF